MFSVTSENHFFTQPRANLVLLTAAAKNEEVEFQICWAIYTLCTVLIS